MDIRDFPVPVCVKDMRSFLGLANQLGCFVTDLAMVTAPLYSLLKKSVAWTWTPAHGKAFKDTKDLLVSPSVIL